jgi:hypothetical protein
MAVLRRGPTSHETKKYPKRFVGWQHMAVIPMLTPRHRQ